MPVDFYWIDAEWFWPWAVAFHAGDWRVNADIYPHGFRPHQRGDSCLWPPAAPVVRAGAGLRGHPLGQGPREKWLLTVPEPRKIYRGGGKQTLPDWHKSESLRNQMKDGDRLLNLGDPAAQKFLADFIPGVSRSSEWIATDTTRTSRRWSSGGLPIRPTARG